MNITHADSYDRYVAASDALSGLERVLAAVAEVLGSAPAAPASAGESRCAALPEGDV